MGGISTDITPSSSRNPSPPCSYFTSPIPSYQPSPSSSSFPSPSWLNANASLHSFSFLRNSIPSSLPPLRISNSAPVSPLLSSPTRLLNQSFNFESLAKESVSPLNISFFASSAPTSPTRSQCLESGRSTIHSGQWMNFRAYATASNMVPTSSMFNLVRPVAQRVPSKDVVLEKETDMQFNFENVAGKPWEGERIHEVGSDDLELTLGSGNTRI
ncbi:Protein BRASSINAZOLE-RESISTANT 1 [Forsythia ovata]|uniref:Protein BZR1 homolog n=1 Tax=Forsythia ovata TaxID=205694 RepID=A0ABD1RMG6_9LAMI